MPLFFSSQLQISVLWPEPKRSRNAEDPFFSRQTGIFLPVIRDPFIDLVSSPSDGVGTIKGATFCSLQRSTKSFPFQFAIRSPPSFLARSTSGTPSPSKSSAVNTDKLG